LWIRTPLIPGVTATTENITAIGSFIAKELNGAVSRWELCSFNNSCIAKYQRLNLPWAYHDTPLIDHETSEALRMAAMASGVNEELIVVTGLISE
jgi:pyruvate formate lyase activating enzyme